MKGKKIKILEFPSNLGLKKKLHEIEPGVRHLPEWLNTHGLHSRIKPTAVLRIDSPKYSMDLDVESGVRNADKIVEYAKAQSKIFYDSIGENSFQIILGGDCSILIGSSMALKQKGDYGLFFS